MSRALKNPTRGFVFQSHRSPPSPRVTRPWHQLLTSSKQLHILHHLPQLPNISQTMFHFFLPQLFLPFLVYFRKTPLIFHRSRHFIPSSLIFSSHKFFNFLTLVRNIHCKQGRDIFQDFSKQSNLETLSKQTPSYVRHWSESFFNQRKMFKKLKSSSPSWALNILFLIQIEAI